MRALGRVLAVAAVAVVGVVAVAGVVWALAGPADREPERDCWLAGAR